jgi:hypothetical protein
VVNSLIAFYFIYIGNPTTTTRKPKCVSFYIFIVCHQFIICFCEQSRKASIPLWYQGLHRMECSPFVTWEYGKGPNNNIIIAKSVQLFFIFYPLKICLSNETKEENARRIFTIYIILLRKGLFIRMFFRTSLFCKDS